MFTPKSIFAIFLRLVGVLVFLNGIRYIADFFLGSVGYFKLQHTEYAYYVLLGMGHLMIGMYLTRGAPAVVDYAYPEADENRVEAVADEPIPAAEADNRAD